MTVTKTLGNYTLDIVDVVDFKNYYDENKGNFTGNAVNAYFKAVDIPPKFFKEQPESTQEELLVNRESFVKEKKKYAGKVIVVLKVGESIYNACRLSSVEVDAKFEKLKDIEEVKNKFEHRSFIKDGYISFMISGDVKAKTENKVLVVDFPILLNKKPVIHKAFYSIPDETFAVPVEHINYLTSEEIDLDYDYNSIKAAIEDRVNFLTDEVETKEAEDILREPEVVALALVDQGVIANSYKDKVLSHIKDQIEQGRFLTTWTLEAFVLDFEEDVKSYKQVTSLRNVNGVGILKTLNSERFKVLLEEMESENEEKELVAY